jgi:ABC-type Fe3+-siderophore transport system permease subunit
MFSKSDIEKYFMAEKQESLVFVIIGSLAVLAAVYFLFFHQSSFGKGIAIPLILVAIIQITVGVTVYRRSDQQRIDNVYCYDLDPSKLRNEEVPRMVVVMKNFIVIRWVEIALAMAGLTLVLLFRNDAMKVFWYGVGMGLGIQAILMLAADFFAERRGQVYLDGLRSFLKI